jgi:hypothetical protein
MVERPVGYTANTPVSLGSSSDVDAVTVLLVVAMATNGTN